MPAPAAFDVTAVIPLHDKAPFIAATIRSVLAQSQPPAAIIVIDDSSSDEGPALVADIAARHLHANIRLIRQPNAGPGPARNRGIAEAATEWIALLDADDQWRPDHIATLASLAADFPQADLLATGYRVAASAAALSPAADRHAPYLLDLFALQPATSPLSASSVAIRRAAIARSGGFGAFMPGEDFELWARLALDHAIAATPHVTAAYVPRTGGLMDQFEARGDGGVLQPIFDTLDFALADPARAARHTAIRRYRAALLRQTVRQALYRAEPRTARAFLDSGDIGSGREATFLILLARLPAPLLRAGMRARKVLRRRSSMTPRNGSDAIVSSEILFDDD